MENEKLTYFEEIQQLGSKYVEDRLLLVKLQAAEKAAKLSSSLVKAIVAGVLVFFILLILSFLAGYGLSIITGSLLYGFGILAGIYAILLIVFLYAYKKSLNKYIADKVVETFFDKRRIKKMNNDLTHIKSVATLKQEQEIIRGRLKMYEKEFKKKLQQLPGEAAAAGANNFIPRFLRGKITDTALNGGKFLINKFFVNEDEDKKTILPAVKKPGLFTIAKNVFRMLKKKK
jgi:ABC-type multidrug transport system fused ATPase/permease subunit